MEIKYVQYEACPACKATHNVCIIGGPKPPNPTQAYEYLCPTCKKRIIFYPRAFGVELGELQIPVTLANPIETIKH